MFPQINAFLAGCSLLLLAHVAIAKPISVALIQVDASAQTTVAAIKHLQQEPALKDVSFSILPFSQISERDLTKLEQADVALIYNMGREIATAITPAVKRLNDRGAKAYAIGAAFEEDEKRAGLTQDEVLRAYNQAGGVDNISAMIKRVLARDFGLPLKYAEAVPFPMSGLWNPRTGKIFAQFDDYAADYLRQRPNSQNQPNSQHQLNSQNQANFQSQPWIGILFNRPTALAGHSLLLSSITAELEARGFNVVPAFGYPSDTAVQKYLMDGTGKARVAAVVGLALKLGNTPDKTIPVMARLNVPVINAISLQNQTRQEWEESTLGLSLTDRSWQISLAEFAGAIAPTVVAARERQRDAETGLEYIAESPIPERVQRLADRIQKWVALRTEANPHKKIAFIYYNYPAGKENIGAAYLNVLPRSLWQILTRLKQEGYNTSGQPTTEQGLFEALHEHGTNIGSWSPGALEKLVRAGNAVIWPVSEYRKWFNQQPESLRSAVIKTWGEPENGKVMLWKDAQGQPNFVFPAQRYGNLVFAPQPARGWEGDPDKIAHDAALPPHHQYLAFYFWLQKEFAANAMVHVGTHGTHEWLSGKEVGFTNADPSEVLMADVPQLYPYIVDDIGEALQAKRRGMAATISYMTPPFDKATLNKELKLLKGLVDDYAIAVQKSESAAAAKLTEIDRQARKTGVLKDIGFDSVKDAHAVEHLDEYFEEISNASAPYGLHTFGVAPSPELRLSTAEAVLSMATPLAPADHNRRKTEISNLIVESAANELNALVNGLAGHHIVAGPGGDPIRNLDSLPTGRNLYGFDPNRLPTPGTWAQGKKLADTFVADYLKRHKTYPDKVVFNLWSTETMSHEGVTEAEILALMGVKPTWDERGKVARLEVISRKELGRPRVDVTITPSGLYRDTLPNLMQLLDDAVSKVKDLDEPDNPIYANVRKVRTQLEAQGIAPADATKMAAVRIFTEVTGVYGTGVSDMVDASNNWENEAEVADVYFKRVGNLFGQGYWGDSPGSKALAVDIFKLALKDAKATIHARSSNLFATLDSDDVYQYLGASAMAIRQVNGKTPETLVLNLADPKGGKHETLDKYLGREMRTRYTNPEWISAMLKEGYSGARFVKTVTDNLWGWQVTVPEAIDGAKWQEMYETYVADRNNLGIKDQFRAANNLLAYQAVVDKMLVAINKGYWQADPTLKTHLEQVNREVIAEAGVACDASSCSSPEVTALAQAQDNKAMTEALALPAPTVSAPTALAKTQNTQAVATQTINQPPVAQAQTAQPDSPAPATVPAPTPEAKSEAENNAADNIVEGFEITEESKTASTTSPEVTNWALFGMGVLVVIGFFGNTRRRRSFLPDN